MFGKNKNKKVGLCVMVVTASLVLAGIWTVLATPETALAKKPTDPGGGGGGKGGAAPNCVIFDDGNNSVRSDDPPGDPYCHNKKENITVKFSHDGHLKLDTNSTDKAAVGRGLFIDFGTPVTLAPGTDNEMTITTTDDALDDIERVLGVSADLKVGASQDEFNFFDMDVGSFNEDVNLHIRVFFYFTDGSRDNLLIRLRPNVIGTNRQCPSSDDVTVTYLGTPDTDGLRKWRVETLDDDGAFVARRACISRGFGCEEGDECLLFDVNYPDDPGHVYLQFGFTVTAAP